jgi:hypothetical protein
MLKRFWLFIGENFYPSGGMKDFIRGFDTFDEVTAFLDSGTWTEDPDEPPKRFERRAQWWEVLDTVELKTLSPFKDWTEVLEK